MLEIAENDHNFPRSQVADICDIETRFFEISDGILKRLSAAFLVTVVNNFSEFYPTRDELTKDCHSCLQTRTPLNEKTGMPKETADICV